MTSRAEKQNSGALSTLARFPMHSKFAVIAVILLAGTIAQGQDDLAMRAMKDELARSVSELQLEKMDKPYFLSYRLDDVDQISVSAMLGSLTAMQPTRTRFVGVEVRVGDYALDNTNYISIRNLSGMADTFAIAQAPLDDNYQQIRRAFWLATDAQYKKALEDLSAKRAAMGVRKPTDNIPDFSKEPTATHVDRSSAVRISSDDLSGLARSLSAVFRETPDIHSSSVTLEFQNHYVRYVNSEGSTFTRSEPTVSLRINAETQSSDGMPISDSIELYGTELNALPSREALLGQTRALAARILQMRASQTVERYNGPVLFEGQAAGEAFALQFAGGLTTVRTPMSDEPRFAAFFNQFLSQLGAPSFVDKIGGRVLPDFLSVSDQPLLTEYKGAALLGTSKIDDDAVVPRETKLVEHGLLKTLLTTRVPVRAISHSTGSRHGWGPSPSNLFVTSEKTETNAALRKELLSRAQARGLEYGIVVRRVGEGGTNLFLKMASQFAQQEEQSGNSMAEVYKLYPDGREELVRGMEIAEMPPSTFRDIVATGDQPVVFNDMFIPRGGALFSGGFSTAMDLPIVSYVVPSLLFEELSLVKTRGPLPNLPASPSPLAKQ